MKLSAKVASRLRLGVLIGTAISIVAAGMSRSANLTQHSLYVDFEREPVGAVASEFKSARGFGRESAQFVVEQFRDHKVLTEVAPSPKDVLYYPVGLDSVRESYAFVYEGPQSVVDPFLVNAVSGSRFAGTGTDLSASAPKNDAAGDEFYEYTEKSNAVPIRYIHGRLRTEPYFYEMGHTYRVDMIADPTTRVLSTRVYDVALGPQAFDRSVQFTSPGFHVYPGLMNPLGGSIAVSDFSFGPATDPPMTPHLARRSFDYIRYLGYNAAVNGPVTSPESLAFQKYFPPLLISHVRIPSDGGDFAPSLNAVSRFGIDADVLTSNKTTIDRLEAFVTSLKLPPDSIELWNEPNNPSEGSAYDPNYAVDLPQFARAVNRTFPNVTVWGPSVLPDQDGYPTAAKALASPVGSSISGWNSHAYAADTPENVGYGNFITGACGPTMKEDCGWYGAPNWNDNVSAVINPRLPGITSEGAASYGSYPAICGHTNVSLRAQQAYLQRGMLYGYKLGHRRIYPYKFIDDGKCSDGFGTYGILSRIRYDDGRLLITPKPAYTALVNLDHLLHDDGSGAADFAPTPLSYALEGASPDVEELLLAVSDGSYRLVLWSDESLWDFNANGVRSAGTDLEGKADHVVVRFPFLVSAASFDQRESRGAWREGQRLEGISSVPLTVTPFPLVLFVRPESVRIDVARRLELKSDVPTPGPTETP